MTALEIVANPSRCLMSLPRLSTALQCMRGREGGREAAAEPNGRLGLSLDSNTVSMVSSVMNPLLSSAIFASTDTQRSCNPYERVPVATKLFVGCSCPAEGPAAAT